MTTSRWMSFLLALLFPLVPPAHSRQAPADLEDLQARLKRSPEAGALDNAEHHIQAIGTLGSRSAAEHLTRVALGVRRCPGSDESQKLRVYRAVPGALSRLSDPGARSYIFKRVARLQDRADTHEKTFLADVIAQMKGSDAEKALIGLHPDGGFPAVQILALESLGRVWSAEAVPAIIALLEVEEARMGLVWRAALDALQEITAEGLQSSDSWKRFWEVRGPTFDPSVVKRELAKRDPQRTVTRAFDPKTILLSRRAVIVIDVSFSMHFEDPPWVKLFTYGFSREEDEEFMRALAYENGGTCTSVQWACGFGGAPDAQPEGTPAGRRLREVET